MDPLLRCPRRQAPWCHLPRFLCRNWRAFRQPRHHQGRDQEPVQPKWRRWHTQGLQQERVQAESVCKEGGRWLGLVLLEVCPVRFGLDRSLCWIHRLPLKQKTRQILRVISCFVFHVYLVIGHQKWENNVSENEKQDFAGLWKAQDQKCRLQTTSYYIYSS